MPRRPTTCLHPVPALVTAVLAAVWVSGCAPANAPIPIVSKKKEGFSEHVDSLFVTVALTKKTKGYAGEIATAFDTLLNERDVTIRTTPRGHEMVRRVPGLDSARTAGIPYVLVVSHASSTGDATHTFEYQAGTFDGNSGGDEGASLVGAILDASLFVTTSEQRVWRAQVELQGRPEPTELVRRVANRLTKDGLIEAELRPTSSSTSVSH